MGKGSEEAQFDHVPVRLYVVALQNYQFMFDKDTSFANNCINNNSNDSSSHFRSIDIFSFCADKPVTSQ